MSSRHTTFLQACLDGEAVLEDVDDWVDAWHESDGRLRGGYEDLYQYLGFSKLEYAAWAEKPSLLRAIVAGREQGRTFDDVQNDASAALVAARSKKDKSAADLVAWLRSTGRIDETA